MYDFVVTDKTADEWGRAGRWFDETCGFALRIEEALHLGADRLIACTRFGNKRAACARLLIKSRVEDLFHARPLLGIHGWALPVSIAAN
jgi:hypothetical protein